MKSHSAVTYDQYGQFNIPLPKRVGSTDKFYGFSVEIKPAIFTKKEFVGSGLFGSVFKAKTIDGREVAVKKVPKDELRNNCCVAEIEKQNLEYMSGVNFQNFIGYFGGYVLEDYVHFVLELGDIALDKLLELKLDEMGVHGFNNIAYQTLGMVGFLNRIGMRHGDMHFANMVYFYSTDQIKLVDFERSSFPGDHDNYSPFLDLGLLGRCLFELQLVIKGYGRVDAMLITRKSLVTSDIDHVLRQKALWLDDLNEFCKCSIMVAGNIRKTLCVSPRLGEKKGKLVVEGRDCFFPRVRLPLAER